MLKSAVMVATLLGLATTQVTATTSLAADLCLGSKANTVQCLTNVPKDINWSAKALTAAAMAQEYFKSKLSSEIKAQKSQGAVRLEKSYSQADPSFSSTDWRNYVQDIRPYKIKGFDSNNRLVRISETFPEPTSFMAASMVRLGQNKCSLKGFNLFDSGTWWQTSCSIETPSQSDFLRASLRSWLRMTDGPISFASFPQQQLDLCFEMKAKFKITGQQLSCPSLSKYFNSQTTANLYFLDSQGGYEITVNEKARTYTTRYFAPDFYTLATYAKWDKQLATITFTPITY